MTDSLSIYVHIPFCLRKCDYCDFYSIESTSDLARYLRCCATELERIREMVGHRKVASIYLGGGTPSILDPASILALTRPFLSNKKCIPEITIEANPSSFSIGKFEGWKQAGINRLSLGIQSFDNRILKALGRLHSADAAIQAYHAARKAGCQNLGIDLMFGIPGQTARNWDSTLLKAVELKPEHISVYGLTVAAGTKLHTDVELGNRRLPRPEVYNRMFVRAHAVLTKAGYEHYEISNYALPGYRSIHNSRYWEGEDCVGIGAAAHSQVGRKRWANLPDVARYCKAVEGGASPMAWEELVSRKARLNEAIMLGLRTAEGASLSRLAELGFKKEKESIIEALRREKLLLVSKNRIGLTLHGMTVADEIIGRLIE